MTEKRFTLEISSFSGNHMKFLNILDNGKRLNSEEIVDLLNEQQSDLIYLAKFIGEFKVEEFKLKLRNLRILEDKVLEQQATIKQLRQSVEYWQKKYEEGTETFQID
jgi:hypothetical protein